MAVFNHDSDDSPNGVMTDRRWLSELLSVWCNQSIRPIWSKERNKPARPDEPENLTGPLSI